MSESLPKEFGDYALLRALGRGGMGQVFLAKVRAKGLSGVDKLCVVKTLHATNDPEYERRFVDEARLIVLLAHKNICHVFDAGCFEGQYYLAMEHINGRELRDVQKLCEMHHAPLPVDVGIFIIKEILEALDAAHRMAHPITGEALRVVHRDVSPQNVMLSSEGEVKLIDFGLAESSQKVERTAPRIVMGKIAYMAPEQARGDAGLDGRADQFAVGVMLYEMLSNGRYYGELPFDDVWRMSGRGGHTPPLLHTLDPGLQAIIKKATAPNRDDRYATCADMRAALQRVELQRGALAGSRETREALHQLLSLAGEQLPSLSSPEMKALLKTSPAQTFPSPPPSPPAKPTEPPPTLVTPQVEHAKTVLDLPRADVSSPNAAADAEARRERTRTFRIRAVSTADGAPGIENLGPHEKTEIGFVVEGLDAGALGALKTVETRASMPSPSALMPPPTGPTGATATLQVPVVEMTRFDVSSSTPAAPEPTQLVRRGQKSADATDPVRLRTATIETPSPFRTDPPLAADELAATKKPVALYAALGALVMVVVALVLVLKPSGGKEVVDAGAVAAAAADAGVVVAVAAPVDAGASVTAAVDAGSAVVDAGATVATAVVDAGVVALAPVVDVHNDVRNDGRNDGHNDEPRRPKKDPKKEPKKETPSSSSTSTSPSPSPSPPTTSTPRTKLPPWPENEKALQKAKFVLANCGKFDCAKELSGNMTLGAAELELRARRCYDLCSRQ